LGFDERLFWLLGLVYKYTYLLAYSINLTVRNVTETTTIRVSKQTAEKLEQIRERINAESLDETIQSLIKKQRKEILDKMFGIDKGIKPFTEEDRGEDRN
jgi:hypothetical protein